MRDVLETPRIGLAAVAAAAILAGLAGGWGVGTLIRSEVDPPDTGDPAELVLPQDLAVPPEKVMDYGAMLQALAAAGMRIVPEALLQSLDVPAIGHDGRLTEPVADALLLREEETDRLNRALAEAEIRLREIELDRLQVVERSADRLEIRFEAFREEGAGVERMLRERIAAVIGQIDAELLWSLMTRENAGPGFDYWREFGREPAAVVFERRIVDENNDGQTVEIRFFCLSYAPEITEDEISPREDSAGFMRFRVGEGTAPPPDAWALLAGRYAYLYEFLPPEWERYFPPDS